MNIQRVKGFSLLELLVTVAIVGIISAIALPSMSEMINRSKISTYANNLHHAISLARSEAIKRGVSVVVCTSNSDQTACSGNGGWEQGWLVIERTPVAGRDPIILIHQALDAGFTFHGNTTDNAKSIRFSASGTTSENGHLVLCQGTTVNDKTKSILISRFGQVSVKGTSHYTPPQCYNGTA